MTTLALINKQTNICENVTLDDRPASEIQIEGYLVLDLDTIGNGGVGDVWDGKNLNKPASLSMEGQPVTEGIQTL